MALNVSQSFEIEQLLTNRRKIEAIKVYREATGEDLKDAKKAVEAIERQLKQDRPWLFESSPSSDATSSALTSNGTSSLNPETVRKAKRTGILLFIIIDTIIFGAIFYWFFVKDGAFFDDVLSSLTPVTHQPAPLEPSKTPVSTPSSTLVSPSVSPSVSKVVPTPVATPVPKVTTAKNISLTGEADRVRLPVINVDDFHAATTPDETFAALYKAKAADPDYIDRNK